MTEPEAISQLTAVLGGDQGWLARVVSIMGMARVLSKLFSHHLCEFMTAAVNTLGEDQKMKLWMQGAMKSRIYRISAFLIDYFLSIKLPKAHKDPPDVV